LNGLVIGGVLGAGIAVASSVIEAASSFHDRMEMPPACLPVCQPAGLPASRPANQPGRRPAFQRSSAIF